MTFRLSALMSAAAAVLALAAPAAHAAGTVLNFDDLTGTGPAAYGNWTYNGFTFGSNPGIRVTPCTYCVGSWYYSDAPLTYDPDGPGLLPAVNINLASSGLTSLSTDYANSIRTDPLNNTLSLGITRAAPFFFDGASFAVVDDNVQINFVGYLGGVQVGVSNTLSLGIGNPSTWLSSGFGSTPVDEIRVFSEQGWFAMDDFTYDVVPIPEPSTYLMMLAGLAGVGALARRKAKKA